VCEEGEERNQVRSHTTGNNFPNYAQQKSTTTTGIKEFSGIGKSERKRKWEKVIFVLRALIGGKSVPSSSPYLILMESNCRNLFGMVKVGHLNSRENPIINWEMD